MKNQKQNKINRGGYSGTGMLPIYSIFCTTIFLITPAIGMAWATSLMFILGISTAVLAKKHSHKISSKVELLRKRASESGLPQQAPAASHQTAQALRS